MFQIPEMTEARVAKRRRPKLHGNLVASYGFRVSPHVAIAEQALGKKLPFGAEVHHVDENPSNNEPSNLVVCPDAAYHKLLHQRQRAFDACGNYDWRKCHICKQYDDPANLWVSRKKSHHRACDAARAAVYRKSHSGAI